MFRRDRFTILKQLYMCPGGGQVGTWIVDGGRVEIKDAQRNKATRLESETSV